MPRRKKDPAATQTPGSMDPLGAALAQAVAPVVQAQVTETVGKLMLQWLRANAPHLLVQSSPIKPAELASDHAPQAAPVAALPPVAAEEGRGTPPTKALQSGPRKGSQNGAAPTPPASGD